MKNDSHVAVVAAVVAPVTAAGTAAVAVVTAPAVAVAANAVAAVGMRSRSRVGRDGGQTQLATGSEDKR